MARVVVLVTALAGVGCHLVFPYENSDEAVDSCTAVDVATGCWDVKAELTAATLPIEPAAQMVFGQTTPINTPRAALLRASDPLPTSTSEECFRTKVNYEFFPAWSITRQRIDDKHYKILVSGTSQKSCDANGLPLFEPLFAGTLAVNNARHWKIVKANSRCEAQHPTGMTPECAVEEFSASWRSVSHCGGCCACNDGARTALDLDVIRE
jgi:hypothetical protein